MEDLFVGKEINKMFDLYYKNDELKKISICWELQVLLNILKELAECWWMIGKYPEEMGSQGTNLGFYPHSAQNVALFMIL